MERDYNPNNGRTNPFVYIKIRDNLFIETAAYEDNLRGRHDNKRVFRVIVFTIRAYFKYFNLAIANGYPIKTRWGATIQLEKEEVRKLDRKEKARYFTSNRVFGWMFKIVYKDKIRKNKETTMLFYPHIVMSSVLQENLNSDVIYELLKP